MSIDDFEDSSATERAIESTSAPNIDDFKDDSVTARAEQAEPRPNIDDLKDDSATARAQEAEPRPNIDDFKDDPPTKPCDADDGWPKLLLFGRDPTVPFPVEALPRSLRAMVEAVAHSTQVAIEVPASLACSIAVACGGANFEVQVGETHVEPMAFWTMCVLQPGERKTQALKLMSAPLRTWEANRSEHCSTDIALFEQEQQIRETRLKKLRGKAATGEGEEIDEAKREIKELISEQTSAVPPLSGDLIIGDATPEAILMRLQAAGGHLIVADDEGGILQNLLGRYSSNGDANLNGVLQGHSGSAIRVDRVGRPRVYIKRAVITMMLMIQPDLFRDLSARAARGRGFLGRINFVVPHSMVGGRPYHGVGISRAVQREYERAIQSALGPTDQGPPETPHSLFISDELLDLWQPIHDEIELQLAPGQRLSHVADWGSKSAGGITRLAAGFYLIEVGYETAKRSPKIPAEFLARAYAVGKFFADQTLVARDRIAQDEDVKTAVRLFDWLVERDLKLVRRAEITNSTGIKSDQVEAAMEMLEERGIVRREIPRAKRRPGRPPKQSWEVRPDLLAQVGRDAVSDTAPEASLKSAKFAGQADERSGAPSTDRLRNLRNSNVDRDGAPTEVADRLRNQRNSTTADLDSGEATDTVPEPRTQPLPPDPEGRLVL